MHHAPGIASRGKECPSPEKKQAALLESLAAERASINAHT
jgi:hypothetical protein